jgi:hypothetical protein
MTSASTSKRPALKPAQLHAEQARLLHRIESLEAHRLGLERAVEPFGENAMDRLKWQQAFHSIDPGDIVARNGLTGCYSAFINGYVELIKSGVFLSGLTAHKKLHTKDAIDLLYESGGITDEQAELLHALFVLEGRVEHASPDIGADEVRDAVELLRENAAALIASAIRWLSRADIAILPLAAGGESRR